MMSIPKIVHYVWVGPKPFPEEGRRFVETWKRLMPDYEFVAWTEENIDFSPAFLRQAYGVRAYNRVANYARLVALRDHGGIYLDHDVEVLKPFDELLDNQCFFGVQSLDPTARDIVNNAVIGAVPQHPFICEALKALDALDGWRDLGSRTGPGLVSKLLRDHDALIPTDTIVTHAGVVLYPPRFFYPYGWDEEFTPACVKPETIAIHHWDHTWRTKPGLRNRLKRALLKRLTILNPTASAGIARWSNALSRTQHLRSSPDGSAAS